VPLEQGCQVEIFFPTEIELDNNFTELSLLGAFGAPRQPSFQILSESNSVLIPQAC
jgi:hypothetical protein